MLYDIQEADDRLEKDIKRRKRFIWAFIIFVVFVLLLIVPKCVNTWIKFHIPKVSFYDNTPINILDKPVQKMYSYKNSQLKVFKYKSLKKDIYATITPQSYYKISGQVVAYNTYLPEHYGFDYIALYDIGMVWGKLAQSDFFKENCSAKSEEYVEARMLNINCPNYEQALSKLGYSWMEFEALISHTHIVPANYNIIAALNTIKKYDTIELEGELVNVKVDGEINEHLSSLTREDDNGSAIGGGACEIMYVKKVKIGNKVYQ